MSKDRDHGRRKKLPRISETEWEIMRVVWAKAPCPASDVIETLVRADPTWHPKTIKTYLSRLVSKKALGYCKEGRAYVYLPLVTEKDSVGAVSQTFLERIFGGSLQLMLSHFSEQMRLTADEVRELQNVLDQQKGYPGSGKRFNPRTYLALKNQR